MAIDLRTKVTVTDLQDEAGHIIAPVTFRVSTKKRTPDADALIDRETWSPDRQAGENGWRTNRPPSPWESLAPLMAPPGVTAVSGRVLRLDGAPLKDVTLEIEGHETRTDGTGRCKAATTSACPVRSSVCPTGPLR